MSITPKKCVNYVSAVEQHLLLLSHIFQGISALLAYLSQGKAKGRLLFRRTEKTPDSKTVSSCSQKSKKSNNYNNNNNNNHDLLIPPPISITGSPKQHAATLLASSVGRLLLPSCSPVQQLFCKQWIFLNGSQCCTDTCTDRKRPRSDQSRSGPNNQC